MSDAYKKAIEAVCREKRRGWFLEWDQLTDGAMRAGVRADAKAEFDAGLAALPPSTVVNGKLEDWPYITVRCAGCEMSAHGPDGPHTRDVWFLAGMTEDEYDARLDEEE